MNKQTMTYTEFLDKSPMTRFLWLLVIGVAVAQTLDGLDYQSTSYALPQIIQEFKINQAQAGLIASTTNIGLLIGALLFSFLSDRFGRRPVFMSVLGTYAFGTFLSAIAPSYEFLLVARFIAGLGIGAEFPVAFALLAEYAPTRLRHIFIPMGPFFYGVGWVLAGVLSIALIPPFGWRAIYWIGITPALVILYVRQYLPESVRYLLLRGRVEEAGRITRELADRAGFRDVELVPPAQAQAEEQLTTRQRAAILRTTLAGMIALGLLYFCYFIQSFGVNSWLPTIFVQQGFTLVRSFTYTLIIQSVTPFAQFIGSWLQERMDRKYALLLMTVLGAVFFIVFGISFELKLAIAITIAAQFLQGLLGGGVIAVLYTLGTELFPTSVRSIGMGIVTAFGRIGAIVGPYALGLFLTFGTAISQIIYFFTIPLLVAAIIALFLIRVDPRQKALERIVAEAT